MKKQVNEKNMIKFTNMIENMGIRKMVEYYKQSFYKLVVETRVYQTRCTVEKFYFNSSMTQLKVLWLFKLMYEKEKLKIPENTITFISKIIKTVEFIKIKRERESFNRFDLDKLYQEKFASMITKQKLISSQKLQEFSRQWLAKNKFSRHVQLLFELEKISNKKLNEHFQHFKRMTLKKFNKFFKATHFILKQLRERYRQKRNDAFNLLKLNNLKKYYVLEGINRLSNFVNRNQKRNLKSSFTKILLQSYNKNKELITKELRIFNGYKRIEALVNKKQLQDKNIGNRAIRDRAQKKTQEITKGNDILFSLIKEKKKNGLHTMKNELLKNKMRMTINLYQILEKALKGRKKEVLSTIQQLKQRDLEDLYNQYLSKWKQSEKETQKHSYEKDQLLKQNFLNTLKNQFNFLEKLTKMHNRKEKRIAYGILQNSQTPVDDTNQTIKNTIILGNFMNFLEKKRLEELFMSFYTWREYSNPKGFRYIKDKNVYGDDIVKFETFQSDQISLLTIQEKKLLAACLIKNVLNKHILKNKAYFMRRFELEHFRLSKLKIALIIGLLSQEAILIRKKLFWRRMKWNMMRKREEIQMPDPNKKSLITKIYYRSFYQLKSQNEIKQFLKYNEIQILFKRKNRNPKIQ